MFERDVVIADRLDGAYRAHRLLFRYYKDRYAATLLEDALQPRLPIRVLRQGRYGRLLDRPAIKALVATKGDGFLHHDDLLTLWQDEIETYGVTFATWVADTQAERRWNQTSRPGRQLVLQLNFPYLHDEQYRRLIFNASENPFVIRHHPVNRRGRNTLAWARIDIDLHSGEALIEEVQNDWIRSVNRWLDRAMRGYGKFRESAARENLKLYAETVLAPHAAIWSEAVLSAALHVLTRLCGIGRVWYHHSDTGYEVKGMRGRQPPRSLYTDLPKSFCFELTSEAPQFILPAQPRWLRRKLERGEGRFWRMDA